MGKIASVIMNKVRDNTAIYIDGALGGLRGLGNFVDFVDHSPSNLEVNDRISAGYENGYNRCQEIIELSDATQTSVKFISHSMGSAYTKGFIQGMLNYAADNGMDITEKLEFEVDFAPYQPTLQTSVIDKTIVFQHFFDAFAGDLPMPGATGIVTRKNISYNILSAWILPYKEHTISSFSDDIFNYWDTLLK